MCRGVQHPLRGLFLRNYLLQCTRNLLPDAPQDENSDKGTVQDAIDFIMLNFGEMNKLWVRMQHQGPSRERDKRERERRELRILVGTNLVRLSQLENINVETYKKLILPGILEQSVSCKDAISQEYLMECVIQVFPDEYHLATLHEFLGACVDLQQGVQIKNVLIALIDRLAIFATAEGGGIPANLPLFDIFSEQTKNVISSRQEMPPEDIVALQMALVSFAIKCYPDKIDYADKVFGATSNIFDNLKISKIDSYGPVGRELLKFLRIPVDHYNDVIRLLELSHYGDVLIALDYHGRTQAASYILQNMIDQDTRMTDQNAVEGIFALIEPLMQDQEDQPENVESSDDFSEEQSLVARIVSLIQADSCDQQFLLLNSARKAFGVGGPHRIKYTLPPVVFSVYRLIIRFAVENKEDEKIDVKIQKMFVFCMHTIAALVTSAELAELPLRLYLQGAIVADQVNFSSKATVAYEFISKAFSLYEEEISDSRAQLSAISLLIGTMECIKCFVKENHEPLRTQCAHASAKLFKKVDQCRAVCSVAHLLWSGQVADGNGPMHDSAQVLNCLKKALRIASQCMDSAVQVNLYVLVLNSYLYFFEDGCKEITIELLNQVIGRIRDTIRQLEPSIESDQVTTYFNLTISHIRSVMEHENSGVNYDGIIL
ncbi:hypothetical protein AB6A40_005390 [Gnathostoma spinigerum]|uniref:Vacuolar protein sorting-associated protein 35 n=1 Tax=Gnathostoma spinigerum TaxID=75299 RepID=A0ABD6EG52_9BILA